MALPEPDMPEAPTRRKQSYSTDPQTWVTFDLENAKKQTPASPDSDNVFSLRDQIKRGGYNRSSVEIREDDYIFVGDGEENAKFGWHDQFVFPLGQGSQGGGGHTGGSKRASVAYDQAGADAAIAGQNDKSQNVFLSRVTEIVNRNQRQFILSDVTVADLRITGAFTTLFKKLGATMASDDGKSKLRQLFETIDRDNSGEVDKQEWAEGIGQNKQVMTKFFGGSTAGEVIQLFSRIDTDKSGAVSWAEFKAASNGGATMDDAAGSIRKFEMGANSKKTLVRASEAAEFGTYHATTFSSSGLSSPLVAFLFRLSL